MGYRRVRVALARRGILVIVTRVNEPGRGRRSGEAHTPDPAPWSDAVVVIRLTGCPNRIAVRFAFDYCGDAVVKVRAVAAGLISAGALLCEVTAAWGARRKLDDWAYGLTDCTSSLQDRSGNCR